MMTLSELFQRQVKRDVLLHWRQRRLCVNACLFFLMIIVFLPLTMPPDAILLRTIAPGLVWIAMLLALFLSAERLFQQDEEDGVLEQWLVCGYPVSLLVLAKIISHWLINVLPMLLVSPVLTILLHLSPYETLILIMSLIAGTPSIIALCALSAAFGIDVRHKGVLMALILFPLTVPIMILGSVTVTTAMHGADVSAYLALLLAMSCISVTLLPFAISATLKA